LITRSATRSIERLVADLASANEVERDAAIARLTVIGPRAVERLVAAVDGTGATGARAAALRALEGIADSRALDAILRAVDAPEVDVALAAVGAARAFLRSDHGPAALDRLTAAALDRGHPEQVRAAAVRAVGELDRATIKPLLAKLADDASEAVRAAAALRIASRQAPDSTAMLTEAADRALPDDPAALRHAIIEAGGSVSLPELLRIVDRIREREPMVPPARRADWTAARAAAHWGLASRDSRIGLYDVKESLETASAALPVEFMTTLSRVGDVSCLEAIAAAYARAKGDTWWRQHLADVFHAIAQREHVTPRHAAMKKITKRWPEIVRSR
jgi:HEAT repeat protein